MSSSCLTTTINVRLLPRVTKDSLDAAQLLRDAKARHANLKFAPVVAARLGVDQN